MVTKIKKDGASTLSGSPTLKKGSTYTHNQLGHVYHNILIRFLDLKAVCQEFAKIRFFILWGSVFSQLDEFEAEQIHKTNMDLFKTFVVCLSEQGKESENPAFVIKIMLNDSSYQDQMDLLKSYLEKFSKTSLLKPLYGALVDSLNVTFVRYDVDSNPKFWQSIKFSADIKHELMENKKPSDDFKQMYRIIVSMLSEEKQRKNLLLS